MLRCYMDESGLGKNADEVVCCIAGMQCRNSLCIPLQEQWGLKLRDYGIDEFHSKEFWTVATDGGLTGKYKGWSFEKANVFVSDLVRLIHAHKCHLLAAAVNLRDFFSFDQEERQFLTGGTFHIGKDRFLTSGKPSSAYFVAFGAVLAKAVERAAHDGELCHFVFDEQDEYAPLALARVAEIRQHYGRHILGIYTLSDFLGDVGFSPSVRVRPLQGADLVAHVCKEYYRRVMLGQPIEIKNRGLLTPPEIFSHLLTESNHSLFKIDKAVMEKALGGEPTPIDNPDTSSQL